MPQLLRLDEVLRILSESGFFGTKPLTKENVTETSRGAKRYCSIKFPKPEKAENFVQYAAKVHDMDATANGRTVKIRIKY